MCCFFKTIESSWIESSWKFDRMSECHIYSHSYHKYYHIILHFICTSVWLDSEKQCTRKFRLCNQHGSGIHSPTVLQYLQNSLTSIHQIWHLLLLNGFSDWISSGSAGWSSVSGPESLGLQIHHRICFTWSASCTICKSVTHNDCVGERSFRSGFGKIDSSDWEVYVCFVCLVFKSFSMKFAAM